MKNDERAREQRVRRLADRNGYRLSKSRRSIDANNLGEYMLLDASTNLPVLGSSYDAPLEDVLEFMGE